MSLYRLLRIIGQVAVFGNNEKVLIFVLFRVYTGVKCIDIVWN